ncbi:probable cation-transporting ATPase 13A4 [Ambystoma mexicanum]|uniref:probable cation-transporting ATPase 13A4 n=1 Tax=Ambystoma mexicanum TaxID=8296 RepID=UPI0037E74FE6
MLYNVFTKPLFDVLDYLGVTYTNYADDAQILIPITGDYLVDTKALNDIFQVIQAWMFQHEHCLNDNKTELLILGSQHRLNRLDPSFKTFNIDALSNYKEAAKNYKRAVTDAKKSYLDSRISRAISNSKELFKILKEQESVPEPALSAIIQNDEWCLDIQTAMANKLDGIRESIATKKAASDTPGIDLVSNTFIRDPNIPIFDFTPISEEELASIINKLKEIFGYRASFLWIALCIVGYIFSVGVLLLLFYWKPEWSVWANCNPCSLKEANVVLLRSTDEKKYTRKKVRWMRLTQFQGLQNSENPLIADEKSIINRAIRKPDLKVKYIRVQKIRYIWDTTWQMFKKIGMLEEEHSCADIHAKFGSGLSKEEQDVRRLVCGHNVIDVEVAPLWKVFIQKVINLFYIYQFFTVVLWLAEGYLGYAIAILLLCTVTISLSLIELREQAVKLAKLVEAHNDVKVTVLGKDGGCTQVESRLLVPGDIIVLTGKNFFLSCDAILISGSCVLNEGMLTGECIPVTKTQLPHADNSMPWREFSGEDYKRHILFCGTHVIQTESTGQGPARAVVLRTGFNTTKGDMVRSILYPKPVNFKLHRDVGRFFMFLAFLALIGIIYTIIIYVPRGVSAWRIIVESLVLLTSAICPIIPAALTVGILYAKRRLTQKSIFSISPHRINMCGQLNLVCFDKTGTLTEDGLDLLGIVPSGGDSFQRMFKFTPGNSLPWGPLFGSMATCHSLIFLEDRLQGDPLDLKMFEATGWVLQSSGGQDGSNGTSSQCVIVKPGPQAVVRSPEGIAIIFQYPFSSGLQRMTVVTQATGENQATVYMKGAPEMVASFCKPETVPDSFAKELEIYTFQGLRVIGLAHKHMDVGTHDDFDSIPRENLESDLEFLGLLILENRLKPETNAILKELSAANIRIVMITGDNIQTATTVAKNSGMIPKRSRVIMVEAQGPEGSTPASVSWVPVEYPEDEDAGDAQIKAGDDYVVQDEKDYHFAISGKTYANLEKHFYTLLPKLLMNATVFARMSPGQKSTVIEEYRKLDYYVGMCGDGANDCAALKMAHAGISLSEEEASVAAPFNSTITNISCVPDLIKEGRAALVTSFCMFKYMSMFGIIEYINTLLLYWHRNIFGNNQFLVHDFAIMFVIFLTMSSTPAWPKLAPYRPPGQLTSPPMLFSVVYCILWSVAMQTYGFLIVQQQSWYNADDIYSACYPGNVTANTERTLYERAHRGTKNYKSYDNTTLYLLTACHFVIIAFVFSKGKPFRLPVYRNYLFVSVLAIEVAFTLFLIFADFPGLYTVLETVCTPTMWRVHMLIILLVCLVVSTFVEDVVLDNRKLWVWMKKVFKLKPGSNYKKMRIVLEADPEWPPVKRVEYAEPPAKEVNCNIVGHYNPAFDNSEATPNGNPKTRSTAGH